MAYEYTDERREPEADTQPDVEVFHSSARGRVTSKGFEVKTKAGYFYAFGFPGCLHDSDPYGPFPTYEAALADARSHGDCHEDYNPKEDR